MKILALDLGTMTGWAAVTPKGIQSGRWSFAPKRGDGYGRRFLNFRAWLSDQKRWADGFDLVVYEDVRNHSAIDAAHVYGGFLATLTSWCEHHGIAYQGAGVGQIKKFATGKGNADKAMMVAAAKEAGYSPLDDNEADAIHLLRYTIRRMPKEFELDNKNTPLQDAAAHTSSRTHGGLLTG